MSIIRQMTVEDIPAVYKLGLLCFDVNVVPYHTWTVQEVAHHFASECVHCFVAVNDQALVGFALGESAYGAMSDTGHIEWTAVHPDYRNKGIGVRLFLRSFESLLKKGMKRIITDINEENESTSSVVQRLGFRKAATVNYWIKDDSQERKPHSPLTPLSSLPLPDRSADTP